MKRYMNFVPQNIICFNVVECVVLDVYAFCLNDANALFDLSIATYK